MATNVFVEAGGVASLSRVLVWSPNYAPELTGIPPLVTDAADWLSARGHAVEVVTAMPNYPSRRIAPGYRGAVWRSERLGDVDVHRSWLRVRPEESVGDKALYELTFAAFSFPQVVRRLRTADVVLCVVPSLLAACSAAVLVRAAAAAGRRLRLVLWVQDLVLVAAASVDGASGTVRRLLSALRRLEVATVQAGDRVVVCSDGFRDYLVAGGVPSARIETIPNWVDVDWITPVDPNRREGAEPTRFLYAGNLGYTQGFETLVDACRIVGPTVETLIVGDGNAARRVHALADGVGNISVRDPVPRDQFPGLLAAADVHLVLQRRISAGANLPSKIAPYLASGRPIAASIAAGTPAAALLRASGAAVVVPPEEPEKLAEAMLLLHERPELRAELGRAGRGFAERELDRESTLARLERVLVG
jgi:colanic acid biosynthesis glycosyl transferase WcaI